VDYVSSIVEEQEKPVILVGHSMAGVIISQVAENLPEKIAYLVYLAAFLPENKASLLDEVKKSKNHPLSFETQIDKSANEINLVKSNKLIDIFYNTCSAEQAQFALLQLQKEPYQPFLDPIKITEEKFGQVKKFYIECLQDKAILIEDQRRMHGRASCQVVSLNTDHSPFFSDPIGMVEILSKLR
jgi:pimeloyl-ACP methyl ester carboxylesterase